MEIRTTFLPFPGILFLTFISILLLSCKWMAAGNMFHNTGKYESPDHSTDLYFVEVTWIDSSMMLKFAKNFPPSKSGNQYKSSYVFFYEETILFWKKAPSKINADNLKEAFKAVERTNPAATISMSGNLEGGYDTKFHEGFSMD